MAEKKKTQKKDPVRGWVTSAAVHVLYVCLFLFLVANILYSQQMPDLYYSFISGDSRSFVTVLQKGKAVESFIWLFPEVKGLMVQHADEIFAEQNVRHRQIDILKTSLGTHPESPEILYALFQMYQYGGEEKVANMYLEKARALDPTIGK